MLPCCRCWSVYPTCTGIARQFETGLIAVTHDEKTIPAFKRICHIRDGKTLEESGEGKELGGGVDQHFGVRFLSGGNGLQGGNCSFRPAACQVMDALQVEPELRRCAERLRK